MLKIQQKKFPEGNDKVDGRIAQHQDQLAQHDRRECYSRREKASGVSLPGTTLLFFLFQLEQQFFTSPYKPIIAINLP